MKPSLSTALTMAAFLTMCTSGSVYAHHSFAAEFDRDKLVQLTGTVTGMKWSNPHAWIYLDVEDSAGNVVNWALETRAANNLIRLGWRREDLPVGSVLKIEGWQARNGSPTSSVASVVFADGRTLFVGSPDSPAVTQ
ncbi:MAG: hypothetical protein ACI9HK_004743 [Pirellulaceae bacterium]|jgi:hypothetical protein